MALLATFHDEDYLPGYGTVVVRDAGHPDITSVLPDGPLLAELATEALPGGHIACAGHGWLHAHAGDGDQVVQLQAHDHAPALELDAWDDVVETPFGSAAGVVGLTDFMGDPADADPQLGLGSPGLYRVRVSRHAEGQGNRWRLQFWPERQPPGLPRWLARSRPVLAPGRTGWELVLGRGFTILAREVEDATVDRPEGVTVQELEARGPRPGGPVAGWLDAPIMWHPPMEVASTGDPDRDARAQASRQATRRRREQQRAALAQLAAQRGMPAPTTPRGLLGLLTAAGLLDTNERHGQRRYRVAAAPRPVEEVLQLAPEQVARLQRLRASDRHGRFAADVVALALWGPNHTVAASLQQLADRLLATPQQVGHTLDHAHDTGLLQVTGDFTDPAAPVRLTALRRQSP